jgi:hypothetical protein
MTVNAADFVNFFIPLKIISDEYEHITGESSVYSSYDSGYEYPVGADAFHSAIVNAGGDMMEASRKQDVSVAALWANFKTAMFAMTSSDLANGSALRAYFESAWSSDYPEADYPDTYNFSDTYNVIFQAITNCWLYHLYSRIEAEKKAEDKAKNCRKLLYDIIGRAAISPTLSDPLQPDTDAANNHTSVGGYIVQGDMLSATLTGFFDGFSDLED